MTIMELTKQQAGRHSIGAEAKSSPLIHKHRHTERRLNGNGMGFGNLKSCLQ